MTNRTVLGPLPGGGIGLRVSRPGFNVLDGGLTGQQLAFDSRWLNSAVVFMQGAVTVPEGFTNFLTVPFGVTFSVPPPVIAFRDKGGPMTLLQSGNNFVESGWSADGNLNTRLRITTSNMQFGGDASGQGTYVARYIVMRPL